MLVELHGEGGVPNFGATHRDPQNGQSYPVLALVLPWRGHPNASNGTRQ
jgi:hypothetical protein